MHSPGSLSDYTAMGAARLGTDVDAKSVDAKSDSARSVLFVVAVCFVLSGFAALVYQTAWLRQFTLVFGSSHLAVATVLAAYMGGLALGAAVAARWVGRIRRPLLVYGLLEAAIAVTALCVPLLLEAAGHLYEFLLGGQPSPPNAATLGQPVYYLVVGFLVLALPTGFMGATLPLLASHAIERDEEVGARISLLYASNTAGAVVGTIVTAFVLLPVIGLTASVWVGVTANLLVFGMAATLARRVSTHPEAGTGIAPRKAIGFLAGCVLPLCRRGRPWADRADEMLNQQPAWMLLLILLSGMTAFYYEVLWTRMLSHVLGGSVYAFATMLAAFLTGIALGGGIAGPWSKSRDQAARGFAIAQLAIALLSAATFHSIELLIPQSRSILAMSGVAAAVMLPATIFIGATFPLAVRTVARDQADAAAATAKVFSYNTIGAIVGAVLAGFYLIPALGFEGSIRVAILINLGLAAWTLMFVAKRRVLALAGTAVLLLAAWVLYQPGRPVAVTRSSVLTDVETSDIEEIYYAVGRSSTVYLVETQQSYQLRTNGLPEASILPRGAPPVLSPQRYLTAMPVMARPDIESMLIIGYGGGVAIEGTPSSVESIDVIEIEPEVINANRALSGQRAIDPLDDERVDVIFNDGRNALRLTSKVYDAIVSQPSHPWTAAASHLFTLEFMEIAKSRLDDGGVYLQWIDSTFVDAALLRSLAATVLEVFESARVYRVGANDLMILASDAPLDLERTLLQTGRPLNEEPLHFGNIGLNGAEDLIAMLVLDESGVREFADGAPLSTDNRNLMAVRSRYRGDGLSAVGLETLLAPHDPVRDASSWIFTELGPRLDFVYLANRMLRSQQVARARGLADAVPDELTRALIAAQERQFRGDLEQASEILVQILRADPENVYARYAMVSLALPGFAQRDVPDEIRALAAGLPVAPSAVVQGWPLGAAQDWAALAELDRDLNRSDVTDIWYPQTVQLRAEWRVRVANDPRFPREALQLIDRAVLISPDLNLIVLRAIAGIALDDDATFIESTRQVHVYMLEVLRRAKAGEYLLSDEYAQRSLERVQALDARLEELAAGGSRRAARVSDLMSDLLDEYQEFLGSR